MDEKLQKTKAEIAQVRATINKLIDEGQATLSNPHKTPNQVTVPEIKILSASPNLKISPQPPLHFLENTIAHDQSNHRSKSADPKPVDQKCRKSYNVDEARDYMKKQRQQRAAATRSRQTKSTDQLTLELKKERLRELEHKSRELVRRNVQSKRSRSKSSTSTRSSSNVQATAEVPRVTVPEVPKVTVAKVPKVTVAKVPRVTVTEVPKVTVAKVTVTEVPKAEVARVTVTCTQTQTVPEITVTEATLPHINVETQTVPRLVTVPAMNPDFPPIVTDSHNFINTVKRKLTAVTTDRQEEEKRPNLDLEQVEKLKVVPKVNDKSISSKVTGISKPVHKDKSTSSRKDSISRQLFPIPSCDGDSDTSRNIPDITSESSRVDLNLDSVKRLRLNSAPDSCHYSSDFNSFSNGDKVTATRGDSTASPFKRLLERDAVSYNLSQLEPTARTSSSDSVKNVTLRRSPLLEPKLSLKATDVPESNELHLKFEAEVRLVSDFNQSLKHFMDVEEQFQNCRDNLRNNRSMDSLGNVSSVLSRNVTVTRSSGEAGTGDRRRSSFSVPVTSFSSSDLFERSWLNSTCEESNASAATNGGGDENSASLLDDTVISSRRSICSTNLMMLRQMIKEEDARLENLRTTLKIREQSVLDRTRTRLYVLEQQRKQLLDTGKIEEASLLKKKQRGIIIKTEQERNELRILQKLKKKVAENRKNTLNLDIQNLLAKKSRVMLSDHRSSNSFGKRRRSIGPLRVDSGSDSQLKVLESNNSERVDLERFSPLRRTLSMREADLEQRRRAVEQLLQWNCRLRDEERRVEILEMEAASLMRKMKTRRVAKVHQAKTPDDSPTTTTKKTPSPTNAYSSQFEESSPLATDVNNQSQISSISELIDNFSKLEHEISTSMAKDEVSSDKDKDKDGETPEAEEGDEDKTITAPSDPATTTTITTKETSHHQSIVDLTESFTELPNVNSDSLDLSLQEEVKEQQSQVEDESLIKALEDASKVQESISRLKEGPPIRDEEHSGGEANNLPIGDEENNFDSGDEINNHHHGDDANIQNSGDDVNKHHHGDETKSLSGSDDETVTTPAEPAVVDVRKRVSEIMADVAGPMSKSPNVQDLYVTAYDVISDPDDMYNSEAEQLRKKQMAIEQEIKVLEQQQQHLPFPYMREIPNKPPPPYTPPSSYQQPPPLSLIPSDPKEIDELTDYASKIIFIAQQKNNLDNVKFSEKSFKLCSDIYLPTPRGEFLFDLCKEIAAGHYLRCEQMNDPSWLMSCSASSLVGGATRRAKDSAALRQLLQDDLKERFALRKADRGRNVGAVARKWRGKKRDHVDRILLCEGQVDEGVSLELDENCIKDKMTESILKALIRECAVDFGRILAKESD